MATRTIVTSRRQVLRGAGGFTLALPFLPSLAVPARSYAQAVPAKRKRFFAFLTGHGGINPADMFPVAQATQKMDMFPGHTVNFGKLVRTVSGGTATISPVLSGPDGLLTDAIAAKINIIRGLDYPLTAHQTGGHLGNIAGDNATSGGDSALVQASPNVTIDQQMAWSPSFYAGGVPRQRYLYRFADTTVSHSYTWSSPTTRTGTIDMTKANTNLGSLFDSLFMGGIDPPPVIPGAKRPLIVDWVLESYKNLRQGNARLSALDKQRLDDHMSQMSELQRKITATRVNLPPASCRVPARNNADIDWNVATVEHYKLYNDLVAAAFICDATRIAVEGYEGDYIPGGRQAFINYKGDAGNWHTFVAHQYFDPVARQLLMQQGQSVFQNVLLDLASKLQVDEGDGSTVLDNSLLFWSQEAGSETHVPLSVPIVTIGSAGGYFNTGFFVDYRRQVAAAGYVLLKDTHYAGITYNRMTANVLHGMGVAPAEWQRAGKPGFGQTYLSSVAKPLYNAQLLAAAGDPLPIVANG